MTPVLIFGALAAGLVYLVTRQGGAGQLVSEAGAVATQYGSDLTTAIGDVMSGSNNSGGARAQAVELLKSFEGFVDHAYPDPPGSGLYSIGYGHQIRPGDSYDQTSTISESEASDLLLIDLDKYATCVDDAVAVDITDNQRAALYSLCYNIGCAGFQGSTVLRDLNAGDLQGAADAFAMWNKSAGMVNSALGSRRKQESELFAADIAA